MKFDDTLLNLDYLVFSSHKTATQTVVRTLYENGFNCLHCHVLGNIGIENGTFKYFLDHYYSKSKRQLNIITTFREPIERHISSFFQWHGEGAIRMKKVRNITDTIIYKSPINELQRKMIDEMNNQPMERLGQAEESIEHICNELNIDIKDLSYSTRMQYGLHETDTCRVFIFRFDVLTKRLEPLLSSITGRTITQHNANISASKWYNDIYTEFVASLRIPQTTIMDIYESKRDLINLLYPDEYDSLLTATLNRYGE